MRKTWTAFAMLPMLALLATSCQTRTTATGSADVCLIWRGITYSARVDSAETIEQVRQNNASRDRYCGGLP